MVKIDFNTPYYDYDVTLIQIESDKDADAVCKYLAKEDISKEKIEDVRERITYGYLDGGETYCDRITKRIIVLFYEFLSDTSMANAYSHEKRHIEDIILQHCKVEDIEASAYLAGFLGERFYELWKKATK